MEEGKWILRGTSSLSRMPGVEQIKCRICDVEAISGFRKPDVGRSEVGLNGTVDTNGQRVSTRGHV